MKNKNTSVYLKTVAFTALVMSAVMIILGISPFGDKNFLLWDLDIQYKNIYCWYYDVLHGNAGLFYDFSKSLGGNMYSVFGSYLASPVNLLIYFFPPAKMTYFLTLATFIKMLLCSFTCAFYVRNRWKIDNEIIVVIFGVSYGLMEYNVSLCSNLHFLDSIYMLPIVAYGVYKIMEGERGYILALSVGYCLFCNWYVGYMCCFFSIFYWGFEAFYKKHTFKELIKPFYRYILYMLAGVFTGCVTFIPSALASANGKGEMDFSTLKMGFHTTLYMPARALLITSAGNRNYEEPAIYVSAVCYILIALFFINMGVKLREKITSGVFLGFIFLSFSFIPLEVMWTMLNKTKSFHFRYAFVFSFLMIVVACAGYKKIEEDVQSLKLTAVIITALSILFFGIVMTIVADKMYKPWYNRVFVVVAAGMVFLLYFMVKCKGKTRIVASVLLLLLVFSEMYYNTYVAFIGYTLSNNYYVSYVSSMMDTINEVKKYDKENAENNEDGFYRMEKTVASITTDARPYPPASAEDLMFNYNGIVHYSSFYDATVDDLLTYMGYCKKDAMWTNYVSPNIVADSILGVKYVITEKPAAMYEKLDIRKGHRNALVYKNPYALSFGTKVDPKILCGVEYTDNPFDNQEMILERMSGEKQDIYTPQKIENTGNGEWTVTAFEDGDMYGYFAGQHGSIWLTMDGETVEPYFDRGYVNIFYMGNHKKGDKVVLKLEDHKKDCSYDHILYAETLNADKFVDVITKLGEDGLSPKMMKDSMVVCDYDAKEDSTLLLSVPYDEGWKIYVNGKIADYCEALSGLISIDVQKGNNEIVMKYDAPYFKFGLLLSVIGCFMIVMLNFLYRKDGLTDNGKA